MEKVLVLNADYTPLNVTTLRQGFKLVIKGKAEILKEQETPIITEHRSYVRPLIIRLFQYVRFRMRGIRVNRHRIYKRDGHQCVYCGSNRFLTIDHVIPKSRGGSNDWTNLVTCCNKCNVYKSDRTPEEANMTLKKKPYTPSIFSDVIYSSIEKIWEDFKLSFQV